MVPDDAFGLEFDGDLFVDTEHSLMELSATVSIMTC
jgi:hypothetical protein